MELIIRVQEHTSHELGLLHKLSFSRYWESDSNLMPSADKIISATADIKGFKTLTAVCRAYNWDVETIGLVADACNQVKSAKYIHAVNPALLLLPKSTQRGVIEYPEYYITELLKVVDYYKVESVHFTHYSFIENFPHEEIVKQLIILLNPVFISRLQEFVWEIDSRFSDELIEACRFVIEAIYRRPWKGVKVLHAKKFKFIPSEKLDGMDLFVEDV
jgi:hypothetical protein